MGFTFIICLSAAARDSFVELDMIAFLRFLSVAIITSFLCKCKGILAFLSKKSGGGFPGVLYSCRDFQKFPLPRRLCKKSPANAK
jgi:hypothetical protein